MPIREESLITNEIYHIYNRAIDKRRIFTTNTACLRYIDALRFYRSTQFNYSLSTFYRLDEEKRKVIEDKIRIEKYHSVQIVAYALMPTHFHLLVKQLQTDGICKYMSNIKNAFTRFYNVGHNRSGPLFESRFKGVCMRTDEQLMHTSRYIHLNPYSSGIIENELLGYQWSSYKEYVTGEASFVVTKPVLDLFDSNRLKYQHFVMQNAEYQRKLEEMKHKSD